MENIAVFVDFNNDKLSGKSLNLLTKAVSLNSERLMLYTFSKCDSYQLPLIQNIELNVIQSEHAVMLIDSKLVVGLSNDFMNKNIQLALGYKSVLIDSLFPQLGTTTKLKVKSQVTDFEINDSKLTYITSNFNTKALSTYTRTTSNGLLILNANFKYSSPIANDSSVVVSPTIIKIDADKSIQIKSVKHTEAGIALSDAATVVGAGRGLKDPSNWPMIEELASLLQAATACSKPVSDLNWRPHHEHVGQTGIKIAPDIYIACGISGAIQHLAGVNSSNTIVVINNDPEAPFFKNADYSIIGDVFDIIPRLIKKLKNR
jgi:electron transfer flavoprotein alpha subunit